MHRLLIFEDILTRFLETVITLCFGVILCLTVLLVVLRYGFNSSIIWGSEAMNYLFIYTTAMGAAVSVGKKTHINISCLVNLADGKKRKALDLVNYVFIGGINAALGWYSLPWISMVGNSESPVMRVPMWAVQISIPVGCALAVAYCLLHIIRVLTNHEPKGRCTC